jgi:predicted ribosomally synthesized peptide with SipW-like signal peptide
LDKLRDTSDNRFLALFEAYKTHNSVDRLEEELRKLLHKNENICLVLWQGVVATMAYWNARKAVQFGIEAPEEWIQFALAQDSDILIG